MAFLFQEGFSFLGGLFQTEVVSAAEQEFVSVVEQEVVSAVEQEVVSGIGTNVFGTTILGESEHAIVDVASLNELEHITSTMTSNSEGINPFKQVIQPLGMLEEKELEREVASGVVGEAENVASSEQFIENPDELEEFFDIEEYPGELKQEIITNRPFDFDTATPKERLDFNTALRRGKDEFEPLFSDNEVFSTDTLKAADIRVVQAYARGDIEAFDVERSLTSNLSADAFLSRDVDVELDELVDFIGFLPQGTTAGAITAVDGIRQSAQEAVELSTAFVSEQVAAVRDSLAAQLSAKITQTKRLIAAGGALYAFGKGVGSVLGKRQRDTT